MWSKGLFQRTAEPGVFFLDGSIDEQLELLSLVIGSVKSARTAKQSYNSMRLEERFTMCVINSRDSSISEGARGAESSGVLKAPCKYLSAPFELDADRPCWDRCVQLPDVIAEKTYFCGIESKAQVLAHFGERFCFC